jgi:hypothetical protein
MSFCVLVPEAEEVGKLCDQIELHCGGGLKPDGTIQLGVGVVYGVIVGEIATTLLKTPMPLVTDAPVIDMVW